MCGANRLRPGVGGQPGDHVARVPVRWEDRVEDLRDAPAVERLHLPFELLSDDRLRFARALRLPTFEVEGMTLIKRLTLIVDGGRIATAFYPVFPPDRNAGDVVAWLSAHPGP